MAKINRITRSGSSLVTLAELQSGSELFSKTTVRKTQITPELTGSAVLVKRAEIIRRVIDHIIYSDTVSGVQIFADYLLPVDSPLLLFIRGRFVDDLLSTADDADLVPGKGFNEIVAAQEQLKILISVFRVFEDAVLMQSRPALSLDKPLPIDDAIITDLPSLEPGINVFDILQAQEISKLLVAFNRVFEDAVIASEDIQSFDVVKSLQDQQFNADKLDYTAGKTLADLIAEFDQTALAADKTLTDSTQPADDLARDVALIKAHAVFNTDLQAKAVSLVKRDVAEAAERSSLSPGKVLADISSIAEQATKRLLKALADTVIPQDLAGVFDGITYSYGLSRAFSVTALDQFKTSSAYFRPLLDEIANITDVLRLGQGRGVRFFDFMLATDQQSLQPNKGLQDTAIFSDLFLRNITTNRIFEDAAIAGDSNRFSIAIRKFDALTISDFLVALVFKLLTVEDTQPVFDSRVLFSIEKSLSDEPQALHRIFKDVTTQLRDSNNVEDFRSLLIAKLLRDTAITEDLAGVFDGITYNYGLGRAEFLLPDDRFFRTISTRRVFEDIVEPAEFFRRVYGRPASFEDSQNTLDLLSLEPGKIFGDNVGDFLAFTAGYQDLLWDRVIGQAFTSSVLFTSSSVTAGVQVTSSGTAAGQFDGFYAPAIPAIGPIPGTPAGGNYVQFAGTGTRYLTTVPLDLTFTSAESVTFTYIVGSNFNGGDRPDAGENLVLEYSIDQEGSYVTASTIWLATNVWPDGANWRTTSIAIPAAAKTASTIWRWRQTGSPVVAADAYGLFAIYIGTTSVTQVRTLPDDSTLFIGKGLSDSVEQPVTIKRTSRNRYTDLVVITEQPADFFTKQAKQGVLNTVVVKTIEVANSTGFGIENSSVTLTRTSMSTDLVGTVDLLKRVLAANKVTDLSINTADTERTHVVKGLREIVTPAPGGVGRRIISNFSSISEIVTITSVSTTTSIISEIYTTSEISLFEISPVVGTFTNSLLWASSIGVVARQPAAGTGISGFASFEYFDYNSGGARILTSKLIPSFSSLSMYYIAGTNINGGDAPEVGDNLIVEYNTSGNSWTTATTLNFGGSGTNTTWTLTSINLSLGGGNIRIRIRQTNNSGSETDNYGVANTQVTGLQTSVSTTYTTSLSVFSRTITSTGVYSDPVEVGEVAKDLDMRVYRGVIGQVQVKTIDRANGASTSVFLNHGTRTPDFVGSIDQFSAAWDAYRSAANSISIGRDIDDGIRLYNPGINAETLQFSITKFINDETIPDDFLQTFDGLTYVGTMLERDVVVLGLGISRRVSDSDLERTSFDITKLMKQGTNFTVSGVTISAAARGETIRVGQQYGLIRFSRDQQERISFAVEKLADATAEQIVDVNDSIIPRVGRLPVELVVPGFGGAGFGTRVSGDDLERTTFNITMRAYRGTAGSTAINTIDSNPDVEYRVSSVAVARGTRSIDDVGALDSFFLTYAVNRITSDTVLIGSRPSLGMRKFFFGDAVIPDDFLATFDGLTYRAVMLEREIVPAGLNIARRVSGSDVERTPFEITKLMKQGTNFTVSGVTIAASALGETVRIGQQYGGGRFGGDRQERISFDIFKPLDVLEPQIINLADFTAVTLQGLPQIPLEIITVGLNIDRKVSGDDTESTPFLITLSARRGVAGSVAIKTINAAVRNLQSSITINYGPRDFDVVGAVDLFDFFSFKPRSFDETLLLGSGQDQRQRAEERIRFTITKRQLNEDGTQDGSVIEEKPALAATLRAKQTNYASYRIGAATRYFGSPIIQRGNLIKFSETFINQSTSSWQLTGSIAVSQPNIIAGPFSVARTATKISETLSNVAFRVLYPAIGPTTPGVIVSGTTITASIYAKAAERSNLEIAYSNYVNSTIYAMFDLSSGTVSAPGFWQQSPDVGDWTSVSTTMQDVGNGWYRCGFTVNKTNIGAGTVYQATPQFALHNGTTSTYAGTNGFGLYIWGAQVEFADAVNPYIPTTSTQIILASNVANNNDFVLVGDPRTGATKVTGSQLEIISLEPNKGNNDAAVTTDRFRTTSIFIRGAAFTQEFQPALGQYEGNFRYALTQGARIDDLTAGDSVIVSTLLFRTTESILQQGDLDPFGNINTMVSNGFLRMTDYVDIEYLDNDYVGESRSFS